MLCIVYTFWEWFEENTVLEESRNLILTTSNKKWVKHLKCVEEDIRRNYTSLLLKAPSFNYEASVISKISNQLSHENFWKMFDREVQNRRSYYA